MPRRLQLEGIRPASVPPQLRMVMHHALGIDIGSVAIKVAIVRPDGTLLGAWSRPILGHPGRTLENLLTELPAPAEGMDVRVGVTGDGRELVHGPVWSEYEIGALTRAIPILCPGVHTAIEIGGHVARFVVNR